MTTTQKAAAQLNKGLKNCHTVDDIKTMVMLVLNIDDKHLLFNTIVDKLCEKLGIDNIEDVNINDLVEQFLNKLELTGVIRAYDETKSNIVEFAEKCIDYYQKMKKLSMLRFKNIALNRGYVVGPGFKSTRKLTNLIESNL